MSVPAAVKRTAGIRPNMFWDKSAYVLGVVAATNANGTLLLDPQGQPVPDLAGRTAQEHAAFVAAHLELLAEADAPGLVALREFLNRWNWQDFAARNYPAALLGDRKTRTRRPAASVDQGRHGRTKFRRIARLVQRSCL